VEITLLNRIFSASNRRPIKRPKRRFQDSKPSWSPTQPVPERAGWPVSLDSRPCLGCKTRY